jgi:hypothetical protein
MVVMDWSLLPMSPDELDRPDTLRARVLHGLGGLD